jgi:PAS domain S-box-containing protein
MAAERGRREKEDLESNRDPLVLEEKSKRLRQQLNYTNQLLNALLKAENLIVSVHKSNTTFMDIRTGPSHIQLQQYIGKRPSSLLQADMLEAWQQMFQTLCHTRKPVSDELLGQNDGEDQWYRISLLPLDLETDNETYVVSIAKNITRRKKSEQKLCDYQRYLEHQVEKRTRQIAQQHELLQILQDSTQVGMLVIQNRTLVFSNPAFKSIFNISDTDLDIHFLDSCFHKEDQLQADQLQQLLNDSGLSHCRQHLRIYTKTGEVKWIDAYGQRIEYDGSPAVLYTVLDIDAEKMEKLRRQKSDERLRAFAGAMPDLSFVLDEEGRYIDILTERESLLYKPSTELFGTLLSDALPPAVGEAALETIQKAVKTRKIQSCEYHLDLPDGGHWFEGKVSVINEKINGKQLVAWVSRDITDRKKLEELVLNISENEHRRIGNDLHDGLGQNLTAISLLAKKLEHDLDEHVAKVKPTIDQMVTLIHDTIQQTGQLARGLYPATLEKSGLTSALQELAIATESLAGVRCSFIYDATLPSCPSNIGIHLYRIAQEAVTNALKHAQANTIQIRLTRNEEGILLFIRDDGVGLPKTNLNSGIGMMMMRYRANMVKAQINVVNLQPSGTCIECKIPENAFVFK